MLEKIIKQHWPWLILAGLTFLLHSQHTINSDEGVILNAAWNIINGRQLYIDTFEFIGPGAPYLLAIWWKIFGVSYFSAAILGYISILLSAWLLFLITKNLGIKQWAWFTPGLFILSSAFWPAINHNTFNILAIIGATYCLIIAYKKNYLFLLSGLLAGAAVLFTQHKGLVALLIFLFYLAWQFIKQPLKIKHILWWFVGLGLSLAPVFITWPAKVLYQNLIIFPKNNYLATNLLPLWPWLIFVVLTIVFSFCSLIKETKINQSKIKLLFILGLGLISTSLTRPDFNHLIQVAAIIMPLITLNLEKYLIKDNDKKIMAFILSLGLVLSIPKPILDNLAAKTLIKLVNESCPQEKKLYAGPFLPGIYFEMRGLSLLPYSFLITRQHTPEQFIQAAQTLTKQPPNCVILNYEVVEKFSYNKNNPIDNFIAQQYHEVNNLGNIKILIKN